jgi:hypothetical protein
MLSGALFLGLFMLYCPFERARDVIEEAITDFAPGILEYFPRSRRPAPPSVAADPAPHSTSPAEVDPPGV